MPGRMKVLVSACLCGRNCRYDAAHKKDDAVLDALAGCLLLPVCPEVLAGLPVPRIPCQLSGGDGEAVWKDLARVLRQDGRDLTETFKIGARLAFEASVGITLAVLKERSPSCASKRVWIDGRLESGTGLLAVLLRARGIPVFNEEQAAKGLLFPEGNY